MHIREYLSLMNMIMPLVLKVVFVDIENDILVYSKKQRSAQTLSVLIL